MYCLEEIKRMNKEIRPKIKHKPSTGSWQGIHPKVTENNHKLAEINLFNCLKALN